jgi:VIT1/CCC1 family predicted Fe2+/Mn2+ transporter
VPFTETHQHGGSWLREIVLGLSDGLVTTLAFVIAVHGVAPEHLIVVAVTELLAGGVSMGLGAYLSARTEQAILAGRIATEQYEIAHEPAEEYAELKRIYYRKGLRGALLNGVVEYLTADKGRWLNSMVRDELGIIAEEPEPPPWLQGIRVGVAFMVGAALPIAPFVLAWPYPPVGAYVLTLLTALVLGALKARYTQRGAVANAIEFFGIVSIAAAAGFGIGALVSALIH